MLVHARLGIDFGTSNTVAVLGLPDGSLRPLLFDGSPSLPSAVCRQPDGSLLVGRDAAHTARRYPESFEPHPKRLVGDDMVLLGSAEVPTVDLVAAVLRRVADEARRVSGDEPAATVLTHPVAWASQRREKLLAAAERAGLSNPALIPEPVAAANHFARHATVPLGAVAVVYDLGAGTFDASVLRRAGDGFTVLASEGLDDVGGLDVDAAIMGMLAETYAGEPARWARLAAPVDADDRLAARQLWDDVRAAKEILSRATSTFVPVPSIGADVPLGRPQFDELVRPVLDRTVRATASAIRAAGAGEPAAVFLVGGSSRIPLVATLLHRRFGVAPTVLEQPELVVAQGSLAAAAPEAPPPAVPVTTPQSAPAPEAPPPATPEAAPQATAPATVITTAVATAPEAAPAVPPQRRISRRAVITTAVLGGAALAAAGAWRLRGDKVPVSYDHIGSIGSFEAASLTASAHSPTDDLLATGHWNGTVRLWQTTACTPVGDPLDAHPDEVTKALAFSRDGRLLASAGSTGSIKLWDVAGRRLIGAVSAADDTAVYTLAFSPDHRLLAAGGEHGDGIRLWDVSTRRLDGNPLRGHEKIIRSVAFGPDGTVASGAEDYTVRLWNLSTRTPIGAAMTGHTTSVSTVAFHPDGGSVVSASADGTVRRWNVSTRGPVGDPLAHSSDAVGALYTPDGRLLISASDDQRLMFWDTTTWREARKDIPVSVTQFSMNGSGEIIAVANSGWVEVYRIRR